MLRLLNGIQRMLNASYDNKQKGQIKVREDLQGFKVASMIILRFVIQLAKTR